MSRCREPGPGRAFTLRSGFAGRLALLLGALAGCSPASVLMRERAAERALASAEQARAERYAPYELVLARVYLEKAREESAEAHYGEALRLLAGSTQSAARARMLAQARGGEAAR